MAGDAENKRGYRTIFRSISQVFYANAKNSSNTNNSHNNNTTNYNNNSGWSHNNNNDYSEGVGRLTVTLTSITPPTATWTSTSPTISTCTTASAASTASTASTASSSPLAGRAVRSAENISCSECGNPDPNQDPRINPTKLQARRPQTSHQDGMSKTPQPLANTDQNQKLRASSMLDLTSNHPHQKAIRNVDEEALIETDNTVLQSQSTHYRQKHNAAKDASLVLDRDMDVDVDVDVAGDMVETSVWTGTWTGPTISHQPSSTGHKPWATPFNS
ncbi:hypothetical protein M5D96_013758, partial [Drosophila gunungcola]